MTLLQCKKILKELRKDETTPKWEIEFYEKCERKLINDINTKLKEEFKNLDLIKIITKK